MERIKQLDRYQKGLLLLLAVMMVVFGVIYATVTSRVGYLYHDVILQPDEVNGNTVYSGKIEGQDCRFTVTAEKSVTFQCGEKTYGPYTMKEDPSAIPEEDSLHPHTVGIEMKEGDIFRGSVQRMSDFLLMTNEDGTLAGFSVSAPMSDGTMVDGNGNVIDPMEPTVANIYSLLDGSELSRKGEWMAWFLGVFLSIITAVSMLFAEELFRWNLSFQIRNAERAEPSEWEIASRYIGWTVFAVMVLTLYILGLQ